MKKAYFIFITLIPIVKNKVTFQLRESCVESIDRRLRKMLRINSIRGIFRSSIIRALTRSNVALFFTIGISFANASAPFPDPYPEIYEQIEVLPPNIHGWVIHEGVFDPLLIAKLFAASTAAIPFIKKNTGI